MASDSVTVGSSNVFADLGVSDAEEHLLKAGLVAKFADVMRARRLNQTAAAKLTGISQPDLSKLLRGRFRDVSADRLIRALTRLDTEFLAKKYVSPSHRCSGTRLRCQWSLVVCR